MPNWCSNTLSIKGPSAMLQRFHEQFKKPHTFIDCGAEDVDTREFLSGALMEKLSQYESYSIEETQFDKTRVRVIRSREEREGYSLANFVPIDPDGIMEHGWVDWAIDAWGTKWDVDGMYYNDDDLSISSTIDGIPEICYNFETAWSPPEPAVLAMSQHFPELHFVHEYNEEGAEYAGIVEYKGGEEISNKSSGSYPGGYMKFCLVELGDTSYVECPHCGEFFLSYNAEPLSDGEYECPECSKPVPFIT